MEHGEIKGGAFPTDHCHCEASRANESIQNTLRPHGQLNGCKVFGREQVVLSALINDPYISIRLGLNIRQHSINFVQLERGRVF